MNPLDTAATPQPDTKDWTWVLDRPCPECGFDADLVERNRVGARIRAHAALWPDLLAQPGAGLRPDLTTWSVLEYACHVRDVHRVFAGRLSLMLGQDDPMFANWDQDATAAEQRYGDQDPAGVGAELVEAAATAAAAYDAVPDSDSDWGRTGRRRNGSVFTVETLARYHLHDLDHHAWDVRIG